MQAGLPADVSASEIQVAASHSRADGRSACEREQSCGAEPHSLAPVCD